MVQSLKKNCFVVQNTSITYIYIYLLFFVYIMNTLLKLNPAGNLSLQRCYFSTSPILHSWFVKLTNVTQVNTEAATPKHTRKRNYPLTCMRIVLFSKKFVF